MRVGRGKLSKRHPLFAQILLGQSRTTVEQLDTALARQAETGTYLGEVLVEMGAVRPADIQQALHIQVSYYPEGGGP